MSFNFTNKKDFANYINSMSDWEFEVFDAFRSRIRFGSISKDSKTFKALEVFYSHPNDSVAKLLVSKELHKWRPCGVDKFARLVELSLEGRSDEIVQSIHKASTISRKDFRKEYPSYSSVTPLNILETILLVDNSISLNIIGKDTTKAYDGLRESL